MRRARFLRYLVPVAALIVALAGGGLAALEADTATSFGDGVWWALSLVTTVGFVGKTPVTIGGRVLAGALMVFGFGLLSLTAAALASLFVRTDEAASDQRDAAFESEVVRELRALREQLGDISNDSSATHPARTRSRHPPVRPEESL